MQGKHKRFNKQGKIMKGRNKIIDKSGNINQWGKIVSNPNIWETITNCDLSPTYMNAFNMYIHVTNKCNILKVNTIKPGWISFDFFLQTSLIYK